MPRAEGEPADDGVSPIVDPTVPERLARPDAPTFEPPRRRTVPFESDVWLARDDADDGAAAVDGGV